MEIIASLYDAFDNAFDLTNSLYEEQLQFQETLNNNINDEVSCSSLSSLVSCEICTEDKQTSEMFEISGCPHLFCSTCMSKHVEYKLQDNIILITCPKEGCHNIIQPHSLINIIPKIIVERWEEKVIESEILASQKVYCPYDDCSEILVNDSEELSGIVIRECECPKCHRYFCAQCKVPWHQGLTCKEFIRSDRRKKENVKLCLLAKQNKWKKCPNCKVFVDKIDGCIHITCRCKFEFCYSCGSKWNETHWESCQS